MTLSLDRQTKGKRNKTEKDKRYMNIKRIEGKIKMR